MSWLAKLCETYEAAISRDLPGSAKLIPISHTLQNAHINIVIDGQGNFRRASVLEKTQILLPATEKSAGRTSGQAPHPLADKIQYVARDYPAHGGRKESFFASYEKQLAAWCGSKHNHRKATAIHRYISKGRVVEDLLNAHVLHANSEGNLLADWPHRTEKPSIFKVLPPLDKKKRQNKDRPEIEQGDALVCWSVEIGTEPDSNTWEDSSLWQSWTHYEAQEGGRSTGLCYVLGEAAPLASNHPAKLRHTGDKAKLISANDGSGFTFRGRFTDPSALQACGVGFDVTQKAHSALRWLIARQGFRNDSQVYVSWAVSGKPTPEPMKSTADLFAAELAFGAEERDESEGGMDHSVDIGASFAVRLRKYMAGYYAKLDPNEQIVVMGMDSATPGRMAIIYYRELLASEFLERLESWHRDFAWPQRYLTEEHDPNGKKKSRRRVSWPVSSPAPRNIAEAAYGRVLDSSAPLKRSVIERILPCIVDVRPFPHDVVVSTVRRACNRSAKRLTDQYSNVESEKAAWRRELGVACALYKGFYLRHPRKEQRRNYSMTLEEEKRTRDYLYGRLLAIAEWIEEVALRVADESRPTTAARLMQRFADRPFSTWRTIELSLQPYMQRLQSSRAGFLVNRRKELDCVLAAFLPQEFTDDRALSGEFLLGYHCQRQARRKTDGEESQSKEEGE